MADEDDWLDASETAVRVTNGPWKLAGVEDEVSSEEYLAYLLTQKRIKLGEPIPESTFTDVQNPVLRRRLVRAICLRKVSAVQEPTS